MNKIFTKYWFIFLLLFIEGAALMVVELMGAKLLAPFYGGSLYVWTAVLSITLLGLTFGYYFGGHISKKRSNEKILVLIISVSALLVFAIPYTSSMVISLSSNMGLIAGVCIASFLIIVPPMLLFGMIGPLVVRFLTHKVDTVGKVAGSVYFTSTTGGIVATFLFGFYLIPELGLKFASTITSIALAFVVVVFFIKKATSEPVSSIENKQVELKSEKRPKSKKSQKTGTLKKSVYLFAALEGAAVMAVELLAARMLAPYFGASLYVWGAVIGITLFSLALGYYFGGRLSDKYTKLTTINWVLLLASVFLMFMHVTSQSLTLTFNNAPMMLAVVVISVLLIVPALLLLGMVPTLLIKYVTSKVDNAGSTTGKIFTISSFSGILALPLFGFFIIPTFGITGPSIVIGLLVGLIPLITLLKQKKYIALVLLPLLLLSYTSRNKANSSKDVNVKYFSEGLLGQVLVADVLKNGVGNPTNDRYLFVNRMGQTNVDRTTYNSNWIYSTFAIAAASRLPKNSNALVLGLGGGTIANKLIDLEFNVTAIELDERIKNVAKKYFGLKSNVNVIVDDARHYLETTENKYDLIFFDVFIGDSHPAHVLSKECFEKAGSLLNDGGMIVINFNGFLSDEIGKAGRSVFKTLSAAGLVTKILPTPGAESSRNTLFLAGKEALSFNDLRSPLQFKGKEIDMNTLFVDNNELDINNSAVFTDNQSNIDRLNIQASRTWRKSYNKTLTAFFLNNGVPLYN